MTESKTTTDHNTIKAWATERDGHPSIIRTDGKGGILRIDFGEPEASLEKIEWDEFFQVFDSNKLTFLYQEKTEDGGTSRFNKFIDRK